MKKLLEDKENEKERETARNGGHSATHARACRDMDTACSAPALASRNRPLGWRFFPGAEAIVSFLSMAENRKLMVHMAPNDSARRSTRRSLNSPSPAELTVHLSWVSCVGSTYPYYSSMMVPVM